MNTTQIEEALNNAIPIGSRVWGGSTRDSDYDVVMTEEKSKLLEEEFKVANYAPTSYEDDNHLMSKYNYKIFYMNKTVNVIVCPDFRMSLIRIASSVMVGIAETERTKNRVIDRNTRIKKFRLAVQLFENAESIQPEIDINEKDIPFG